MASGTANTSKRKAPAFKPPRPVKAPAQSSTSMKPASTATTSRTAGAPKKTASSRRNDAAPMVINSSEDDEDEGQGGEEDDPFAGSDVDELMGDLDEHATDVIQSQPQLEPIPEKLLGRLLQEGFEDDNTKIIRGAMELTANYMDIFVREALSRAVHERREADGARRGQSGTVFLQVEDLEKLAPQLVLDF